MPTRSVPPAGFIKGEHYHSPQDPAVYYPPKVIAKALRMRAKPNPVRDPEHAKLLAALKKHFSMDEAALRRLVKNPAKLERCVRELKKRGGVRSPYGVCKASIAGTTKRRRRNPPYWYIHIQRGGRGPVMIYNGRSFTNQPDDRPMPFDSSRTALHKARTLLNKHPKLSAYKIWVADMLYGASHEKRRVNPESLAQAAKLDEAAQKLEDFTGKEATHVETARPRSDEKVGLVIGEMDLVGYRAKREGVEGGRMVRYAHKFRRGSRPLLAVTKDGKQLHVVGGQYEFTDAGIEDR